VRVHGWKRALPPSWRWISRQSDADARDHVATGRASSTTNQ
jgi:hypothetical protein